MVNKVWLLVHGGYDFEPTTLAVCSSKKRAEELLREHYSWEPNADYPWNQAFIRDVTLDDFLPWPGVRCGPYTGEGNNGDDKYSESQRKK